MVAQTLSIAFLLVAVAEGKCDFFGTCSTDFESSLLATTWRTEENSDHGNQQGLDRKDSEGFFKHVQNPGKDHRQKREEHSDHGMDRKDGERFSKHAQISGKARRQNGHGKWGKDGQRDGDKDECSAEHIKAVPYVQEELWGTAYAGWEACAGKRQSPINIVTTRTKQNMHGNMLDVQYSASSQAMTLENSGGTLEVQGTLMGLHYWGGWYQSESLQFHYPSEHTVDDKHAPMEMHVVNANEAGDTYTVIGLLFDVGAENHCLSEVLAKMLKAGCTRDLEYFALQCFSEELSGSYWSYAGSLTTPPCTENVNWVVMQRRATISRVQLESFRQMYAENARPVKPLNGRRVTANFVQHHAHTSHKP